MKQTHELFAAAGDQPSAMICKALRNAVGVRIAIVAALHRQSVASARTFLRAESATEAFEERLWYPADCLGELAACIEAAVPSADFGQFRCATAFGRPAL
jgi:hypothetical protein